MKKQYESPEVKIEEYEIEEALCDVSISSADIPLHP